MNLLQLSWNPVGPKHFINTMHQQSAPGDRSANELIISSMFWFASFPSSFGAEVHVHTFSQVKPEPTPKCARVMSSGCPWKSIWCFMFGKVFQCPAVLWALWRWRFNCWRSSKLRQRCSCQNWVLFYNDIVHWNFRRRCLPNCIVYIVNSTTYYRFD